MGNLVAVQVRRRSGIEVSALGPGTGRMGGLGWPRDDLTVEEHRLNPMMDAPEMLAVCDEYDLASIHRIPPARRCAWGPSAKGRWQRSGS